MKKTSKHTTHEAEAKEMPTAPVTVYNPTLTVSHWQRWESTLAVTSRPLHSCLTGSS